jgi:mRNA interferase MazF
MYKKLDIYWVDLDPTRGSETQKKRPCLILQSNLINQGTRTVIVSPILPGHKDWPFVVNVKPTKANGLDKDRHVNLKQLRVVDISRIASKQGVLERYYLSKIKEKIELIFDILRLSQNCFFR